MSQSLIRSTLRHVAVLLVTVAGCGGVDLAARSTSEPVTSLDSAQLTGCSAARDPDSPFIVEWPASEKTNLEVTSKSGLVIVSYVGCNLKILQGCQATGAYGDKTSSLNRDNFELNSETELFARLPLGAPTLVADLKRAGSLTFEYATTGQKVAQGPPNSMFGACSGATHYVRTMTIGAFRVGASAGSAGDVEIGTAGARARTARTRERFGGNLMECVNSGGAQGCDAVLQLGLARLEGVASQSRFGDGLGQLTPVPTKLSGAGIGPTEQPTMKDVNVEILKLVDVATRADENDYMPARERQALWRRVAENDAADANLKTRAAERANAWGRLEKARVERELQIDAAFRRYSDDKAKLSAILSVSDKVVSARQKMEFSTQFEKAYAPWRAAFRERGLEKPVSVAPVRTPSLEVQENDSVSHSYMDVARVSYALPNTLGLTAVESSESGFRTFGGWWRIVCVRYGIPLDRDRGWGASPVAGIDFLGGGGQLAIGSVEIRGGLAVGADLDGLGDCDSPTCSTGFRAFNAEIGVRTEFPGFKHIALTATAVMPAIWLHIDPYDYRVLPAFQLGLAYSK